VSDASEVFAEWFAPPRCWRVLTEASGIRRPEGDVLVTYVQGQFQITGDEFLTPFGTPAGTEGYLIQEVNPQTGEDVGPPMPFR
jgi:hypothetical protein